jgi:hypothetical protein
MPFAASAGGNFGYGRYITLATNSSIPPTPSGPAPSYYTTNSGWLMNQPGYSALSLQIKNLSSISTSTATRSYSGFTSAWTFIHDKDLDSNVWYGMTEGTHVLRRYTLAKGGTTITTSTMFTNNAATTSVLGACYAPACMWTNPSTSYGAFIIGGFSQAVIHVMEFNSNKVIDATSTYTVSYVSEVYGTEVVPKAASGFTNDYGVAYTRGSRQMSSWTVNMSTRAWTNRTDNTYVAGTSGPNNSDGMIYYPIGKSIFANDPDTSTNRLAMNDTSSAFLYVWTITENSGKTALVWTFSKKIPISENGAYPYHMSQTTYNSVI